MCGGRKEIKHYSDSAPFPPYSTTISKGASGTTTAHHSADMSQKKNCLTIPAGVHATSQSVLSVDDAHPLANGMHLEVYAFEIQLTK